MTAQKSQAGEWDEGKVIQCSARLLTGSPWGMRIREGADRARACESVTERRERVDEKSVTRAYKGREGMRQKTSPLVGM